MKRAIAQLAASIHRADPAAAFSFELWDGEILQFGERPSVRMRIGSSDVAKRMFRQGFLGLGEGYIAGEIEVDGDLLELMRLGLIVQFDEKTYSFRQKLHLLPLYFKTMPTPDGSRENVARHYDLTQEFYSLFLDENLAYSCAYFRNGCETLGQAQQNKYEHIARKLMLQPGETLLDVGCGWGGMLFYAAERYGVTGVGNTLSSNQYEFTNRKIEELGFKGRVEVRMLDYRKLSGTFDKFVSIGMFEHVGKRYIPTYMKKVAGLLKKGGIGLLHTISKDAPSDTDAWLQRYIFPGGYIPSLPEIVREMGRANLCILNIENLRLHYGRTLDCWIANFERNIVRIREIYDEGFIRRWRLYLNASSAGFKYGGTRLFQILFSNGLNNDLPIVQDCIYKD